LFYKFSGFYITTRMFLMNLVILMYICTRRIKVVVVVTAKTAM